MIIKYAQNWKIYALCFGWILGISGCHSPSQTDSKNQENLSFKIAGHWYKTALFPKSDPMILEFDSAGHFQCFDFRSGVRSSAFKITKNTLILDNQEDFYIHKMTADTLVISPINQPERKISYSAQNPAQLDSPEKNIFMLMPALRGATVEARVRNIIELFDEKDFVTTETLFFLAGITPTPRQNEREDIPKHRLVIESVKDIQKIGNEFVVHFHNTENIRIKLPIYENQSRYAKQKAVFDLLIKTNTKARIVPLKNGSVRINVDGIKVGKGWLKIDIPAFTVDGDMGKLLGVKFSLLRR